MVELKEGCVHVFDIPHPNGPTSVGKCRRCKGEREMVNSPAANYNPWIYNKKEEDDDAESDD